MRFFHNWKSIKQTKTGFTLNLEENWSFHAQVLEPWLIRVALEPPQGFEPQRSWMVNPGESFPWQGRKRQDLSVFSCPEFQRTERNGVLELISENARMRLISDPLRVELDLRNGNEPWVNVLRDRRSGAWGFNHSKDTTYHFQDRQERDQHFGLGDKSGPLDRSGRRFRMRQMDALGYNAETGDPLYKHVPWLMVRDASSKKLVGLFYDCLAPMTFDLGAERSNYHGFYRYVSAENSGLDLYLIYGEATEIIESFTWLTGLPNLSPRWSLGFGFSSMHLADDPNGEKAIQSFVEDCQHHRIPISSLHFGSGYTLKNGKRYVFTWDKKRFPNAKSMLNQLKQRGLGIVANIKPALLQDHPKFLSMAESGGFLKTPTGDPAISQFWGGPGAHVDFTSPTARIWWKNQLKAEVLVKGIDSAWNDNNEYEVDDDDAQAAGEGFPFPAKQALPLQALLMTRTSVEAQQELHPKLRIYSVTRAGCPGIQRWAETWTGDNQTSWHTLRWNIANGLSLAISGMGRMGHDIGGFSGERPEPELLVRWFQAMALHPRCVMNSWKPETQGMSLPWMHAEMLPRIRSSLHLRYQFLPVLYAAIWRLHHWGTPPITPLWCEFPDDEQCYQADDCFLLGGRVLVAPVLEEGQRSKKVWLPNCSEGWFDFYRGNQLGSGKWIKMMAPLTRLPLIIRGGTLLPLAGRVSTKYPHQTLARKLYVFAGASSQDTESPSKPYWVEDDGISLDYQSGGYCAFHHNISWNKNQVQLTLKTEGQYSLPNLRIPVYCPNLNKRKLLLEPQKIDGYNFDL